MIRLLASLILLAGVAAQGATIVADSISRTDVAAAITAASNGDTIEVPAGDAEWSSAVTIPAGKALKIIGAGKDVSRIINTSGGQNTWCFLVDTELEDAEIRISGLGFYGTNLTGNAQGSGIFVDRWQKNVRIDNCSFTDMRRHAVQFFGFESYGVIDHCYFTNNYTAIEANGRNGLSWDFSSTPYGIGTTNCVVVEDCYFENNDDSLVTDLNNTIYNSNGSRLSMRNCEARGYGTEQNFIFWDSHGNNDQEPFTDDQIDARGTVFVTISNLVLSAESSYRHFYLRGGMHALVNITATGPSGASFVVLTEEECWATMSFGTMLDTWPGPDGITNTWIKNVTYNGVAIDEDDIIDDHGDVNSPEVELRSMDETFIQLDRDYFLVAPESSIPAFDPDGHPTISGGSYGVDWLIYPHPRVTADNLLDSARYVDAATGNDSNDGTEGAPWATIGKANSTVEAGQTVYILEGHYTDAGISPAVTGTVNNPITFKAFEDDVVVIEEVAIGIDMNDKNFVTISGIQFTNVDGFYRILGGTNNTITNCTFKYMRTLGQWGGGVFEESSQSNLVTHSWFEKWGQQDTEDEGSLLDFGDEADATDFTWYNRVEFCTLIHGGHDLINLRSGHNIIRSNYLRNDASIFMNDLGNRGIISHTSSALGGWNLIEGNRIAWSAPSVDSPENNAGINLRTDNNIVRGNLLYENSGAGISIDSGNADSIGSTNAIYHNVLYRNGLLGTDNAHVILQNWGSGFVIVSNAFKNNIFRSADNIFDVSGTDVSINNQFVAGNLESGDPLFADVTTSYDSDDQALPDLSLQSGSPARDAGVFLAFITSASSSGTSFVVDNPHYFQDGWGGITADSIQLEGQTTTALITDIDYETRTITFTPSLTWTQGDGVALPFNGSAPDQGAFELSALSEEYNGAIKPSSGIRASQGVIFK